MYRPCSGSVEFRAQAQLCTLRTGEPRSEPVTVHIQRSYSCIVYAHGSWEERLLEHDSLSLSVAPTSNAMPDDSMQTTSPSEKSAGETAVNRACGSRSGGGLHALRQELSAGESDNIPRPNSHRGSDDANV